MSAALVGDLIAFSVQIALVTVAIAVLLKVVRIPARVRYAGLRVALVALLVTPWLLRVPANLPAEPGTASVAAPASLLSPMTGTYARADKTPPAGSDGLTVPWAPVLLGALLIGVVARGLWLVVGFARLRRLTRLGTVVDADYAELQQQLGTRATITEVVGVAQPATFGVRRPVVMLPDSLATAPESLRRAVITHELFHVRRRDWLSVLAEEMVRTVLWFHPAILWLTSHIQLAREEIVDELTVRATGDRRTYMQALLSFADTPGFTPAPAFAHRRQLFHRILSVSKENVMSRPRIVTSAAALIAVVAGVSWSASALFPIVIATRADLPLATPAGVVTAVRGTDAIAPASNAAAGFQQSAASVTPLQPRQVTPENPIPRRTRGRSPEWPSQVAAGRVAVNTVVTVDRNGEVIGVENRGCTVSGHAAENRNDTICRSFFQTTESALQQWQYDRPVQAPLQFAVVVYFIKPGVAPEVVQSEASFVASRSRDAEHVQFEAGVAAIIDQYRELERAYRLMAERYSPQHPDMARLQEELARLNDEMARVHATRAGAPASDAQERMRRAQEQLQNSRLAQEQAELRAELARLAERIEALPANQAPAVLGSSGADGSRQLIAPSGRVPLRITADGPIPAPRELESPKPAYTPEAMRARIEGTVVMEVLVDEEGRVPDARVIRSIPLLDQAALNTVKTWRFMPSRVNGNPVPVLVTVEMSFNLRESPR
jgi:TonB family protein